MLAWMQDDAGTPETTAPAAAADGQAAADAGTPTAPEAVDRASEAAGEIFSGNFTAENFLTLWETVGWPAVKALILIVIVLLVASWVRRLILGAATRTKLDQTLARFFSNMARWTVLILGALAVLSTFGIETTSFAAVIAAAGFAVGMALSGTLGNFAAGILLLVFRPFRVGDVVTVAGITAKVDEIDLFTTSLDTFDNRRFVIPNSNIFGDTIENISHHPTRRVDVNVGTEYPADIDKVREVLLSAATAVEGRLPDQEPVVYLLEMGDSAINWAVRVWVNSDDFWPTRERLTRDIKVALDEAGIGIPFPQRDVHLFVQSGNLNGG